MKKYLFLVKKKNSNYFTDMQISSYGEIEGYFKSDGFKNIKNLYNDEGSEWEVFSTEPFKFIIVVGDVGDRYYARSETGFEIEIDGREEFERMQKAWEFVGGLYTTVKA